VLPTALRIFSRTGEQKENSRTNQDLFFPSPQKSVLNDSTTQSMIHLSLPPPSPPHSQLPDNQLLSHLTKTHAFTQPTITKHWSFCILSPSHVLRQALARPLAQ
jgi:hypothetical protein